MGTFGDLVLQRYSESQARDDHGRFGEGEGGGKSLTWESPLEDKTAHANALGAQAFKDGQSRSPMGDKALHPLIGGPVGSGASQVMTAWNKGWDTANLAAPLPDEHSPKEEKAGRDRLAAAGKPIMKDVGYGNSSNKPMDKGGSVGVTHNGTRIGTVTLGKDGTFEGKHAFSGVSVGGHKDLNSAIASVAGLHVAGGFLGQGGKSTYKK